MEQNRFLFWAKERRDKKGDKKEDKKGDKPRNQSRNQEEPKNHDGTKTVSSKNWEPHSARELFGEQPKIRDQNHQGTKVTRVGNF